MHNLIFTPAYQLAHAIRCRQVSAMETLDAFLQQIDVHNPKVNAIVTLDIERAYYLARLADEAIARGIGGVRYMAFRLL